MIKEGNLTQLSREFNWKTHTPYWPLEVKFINRVAEVIRVNPNEVLTQRPWEILRNFQEALKSQITTTEIDKTAQIENGVTIDGPVIISKNAHVMTGAIIKGPTYIGPNSRISSNVLIRNSIILGGDFFQDERRQNTGISFSTYIANSIVGYNSRVSSKLSDCIVGDCSWIAGNVAITSRYVNDKNIAVFDGIKKEDISMFSLGSIIGDNTAISSGCIIYPGSLIGKNCTLFPGTIVETPVLDNLLIKPVQTVQILSPNGKNKFFHRKIR